MRGNSRSTGLERERQAQKRAVKVEMGHCVALADKLRHTAIVVQQRQQCILRPQDDSRAGLDQ